MHGWVVGMANGDGFRASVRARKATDSVPFDKFAPRSTGVISPPDCGGLLSEAKSSAFSCAEARGESLTIPLYLHESDVCSDCDLDQQMIVVVTCLIFLPCK